MTVTATKCQACGKEFESRKGKKYCNDGCKYAYHNDGKRPPPEERPPIMPLPALACGLCGAAGIWQWADRTIDAPGGHYYHELHAPHCRHWVNRMNRKVPYEQAIHGGSP